MTAVQIINAAPMTYQLGIQDQSTVPLLASPDAIPTHLPLIYLYTAQGPLTKQLVSGDSMTQLYGAQSFDVRSAYANHATVFANAINARGNALMVQRVVPTDAGPQANFLLSLDVLPTTVPVYERNADGSLTLDINSNPIQSGTTTTTGYLCKWVVSSITTTGGMTAYGSAAVTAGTQTTGGSTPVQSQLYPIMQFRAASVGAGGNNTGIQIWAPTTAVGGINTTTLEGTMAYPFNIAVINRNTITGTAANVPNLSGDPLTNLVLKPGAIDPVTDAYIYAGNNVLLNNYQNLNANPPAFGPFDNVTIYDANVATLVNMFYTAEYAYMQAHTGPASITSDFTGAAGEQYLFNMLGGTTSAGMPYSTFQFATGGVRPSQYLNIYCAGGSDGTMNDSAFASLVSAEITQYANPNSPLMDTATNVESIFYDSGFPTQTKFDLASFIAVRKDTSVVWTTYESMQPVMNESQENSLAVAILARAQLYPESTYFGTSTCRALIMGRCGNFISNEWQNTVPASIEIADKAAQYMGAGDGAWKSGFSFDSAPNNILTLINNINVPFAPANARTADWAAGLNWVQSFDLRQFFIPALKTVYPNDTSVLTGWFTMLAGCEISKVCDRAWRNYSGNESLTAAQLADRIDKYIIANTQGRFDNKYIIVPKTTYTADDTARGYSWTTAVALYAPNMKTVMTSFVQAYRLSDYSSTTN